MKRLRRKCASCWQHGENKAYSKLSLVRAKAICCDAELRLHLHQDDAFSVTFC